MGRNRVSNDLDHVNDEPTATTKAKIPPPEPWPMPKFKPLKIKNGLQHGLGKLPQHVSRTPYDIFSLFFTKEILQKLVDYTNEYENSTEVNIEDKPHARLWFPTTVKELRAYIAIYIYMGLHPDSRIEDFWNTKSTKAIHLSVSIHISQKRWAQINQFFHLAPTSKVHRDVFIKADQLSEHLRITFKQYWRTDTHLTVDEFIQRFMGRSEDIVNIPSKPVPEGYKIWILANGGYVLDWLYHAKGEKKGPVDLNPIYTKEWGFSNTQAVVFDLIQQEGISDD